MDIKHQIIKKLEEIVKELTKEDIKIELSIPSDDSHGDYSANIAMQLFASVKGKGESVKWNSPLELAQEIVAKLEPVILSDSKGSSQEESKKDSSPLVQNDNTKYLSKIEVVKPGFINFYLSKDALLKNAEEVLKDPKEIVGVKQVEKGREAIVDFSSPNIAKPFTIGHLRSTIIGDVIANLLVAVGFKVYRDNHVGDWGTQFGKQIYAIKHWGSEEVIEKSENPVKDLVALYVKFHEEAEKHPEIEDEARAWFKKLEDGDEEARRLWQKCIDWSWKEFEKIYKELGVTFSENNGRGYGEAFFEDKMGVVIEELEQKHLLTEDKGAKLIFYPGDKYPPLMIQKGDGATLYATRDFATDKFRLDNYPKVDLIVNEVGAEQSLYFRQLFEAEYMLGWYKSGQRVHVGHGMFRFKEGKMSTRKGNVIWLEDVLKEAEERAFNLGRDDWKSTNNSQQHAEEHIKGAFEVKKTAKDVAIGALKWNDLKRSAHLDIAFDWDEVLSMQGNSGPYVQYTYTRTHSVLAKAGLVILSGTKDLDSSAKPQNDIHYPSDHTPNQDEIKLLRFIQKFPETVEVAATTYSPNVITEYLFNLSQLFNNFYQKYRILNAATEQEKEFRLALTATLGIVIKQGLNLLGIQAPEKM